MREGGKEAEKQVKLNSVCSSSFPIPLIVATFTGNSLIDLTAQQATPGYSQSVWELQFYRNVMKFYTHVLGCFSLDHVKKIFVFLIIFSQCLKIIIKHSVTTVFPS